MGVALYTLLSAAVNLYSFFILIYVIISWLTAFNIINSYQPFVQTISHMLHSLIDPAARYIRRFVPNFNGVDISILILWLLVNFFIVPLMEEVLKPILVG